MFIPRLIREHHHKFTNALIPGILDSLVSCLCATPWHVGYMYLCTYAGSAVLYAFQQLDSNWIVQNLKKSICKSFKQSTTTCVVEHDTKQLLPNSLSHYKSLNTTSNERSSFLCRGLTWSALMSNSRHVASSEPVANACPLGKN